MDILSTVSEPEILSITGLSEALKRHVESGFRKVRIRGEVGEVKRPSSGHIYLTLKDEKSVLNAIIWKAQALSLALLPEEGLEVIASGRITTYPARSNYQLLITSLEASGEGALLKMLAERRKKLAAEGLFDLDRKKPLPRLPQRIGVISSPSGAVIRDIMHRLDDRFPTPVLLWPSSMQGEFTVRDVTAALQGFATLQGELRPDLIMIARGGGSLEDLMPFNDETLTRAVAACPIPVISAVGHETDTTLCDLAADARAPTPSAAAEMAVPVRSELLAFVQDRGLRLQRIMQRRGERHRLRLDGLSRGIADPRSILDGWQLRLEDKAERVTTAVSRRLERAGWRLGLAQNLEALGGRVYAENLLRFEALSGRLDMTSIQAALKRGFTVVQDMQGRVVTSAAKVQQGQQIDLRFHDGITRVIGS